MNRYASKTLWKWQKCHNKRLLLIGAKNRKLWRYPGLAKVITHAQNVLMVSSKLITNCKHMEEALEYNGWGYYA